MSSRESASLSRRDSRAFLPMRQFLELNMTASTMAPSFSESVLGFTNLSKSRSLKLRLRPSDWEMYMSRPMG